MGLCHSHGFNKRSSSVKTRTKVGSVNSLDRDSNSTQLNEKRGKTPDIKRVKNKDILSEKEFEINKKNKNAKFDIISQIDKMSNYSEKIKYDLIKEEKATNKKPKNIESFFNKVIKPNNISNNNNQNNTKQKPMMNNIRTKFNNYSKKEVETPIKLKNIDNNNYSTIKVNDSDYKNNNKNNKEKIYTKIKNNNKENKLLKILKIKNNNIKNNILYTIYTKQKNNIKKISQEKKNFSTEETYRKCRKNIKDRNFIINNILNLEERKWYDELIELNEFLIKYREKFDMKIFSIYLIKLLKIYEDFNWLIDSISNYYINGKYKNIINNKLNTALPEVNSDIWKLGFNYKGVHIQLIEDENAKIIINEIKALNIFFFDYLQIIDRYQFIKDKQLSNNIIFPLIGYSNINNKILVISALVENSMNSINTIYKEKKINLKNTMGNKFYVDDLLISKLFFNLNENNFIEIKQEKYIIYNLYNQIPNLFEINYDFVQRINFLSAIKNKKIFYTLNYDLINKINIHKDKSKYKTPQDVIQNLYRINISLNKCKDIVINNIHFRIIYENEIQYASQEKNNKQKFFSNDNDNFVDKLFNYSCNKKNGNKLSHIKEPYLIIYDLIDPLKLKYSHIKSNKNYVTNGQNATNEDSNNNNDIERKIYFIESNYISFLTSWCESLSKNGYNIKTYCDLKQNMRKYGINSIFRFFSLILIKNNDINNIIKISFLIKAIKFVFNGETNNAKYNEQGIKFILMKYIKSILYPSEIISKEKEEFNHFYKELIFYSNILFLKLKLIDNYLQLNLLNITDIKDISKNNINIKLNNLKNTELNSPEDFLIHIISIARKVPFLFLSQLEQKLNFIIEPYIKFKSSISIESMKNKLNMEHLTLNYNQNIFSYIKSDELSGLILTKIITRYNSFEESNNIFNKITKNIEEKKEIKGGGEYNGDNINLNLYNKKQPLTPYTPNTPYTPYIKNNNNCQENITNNSDISNEYINYDDILDNNYYTNNNKENGNTLITKKIIQNDNTTLNSIENKLHIQQNQKIEWDNIKNEFLLELPAICYKMPFFNDAEKKDKFNILSLYRNLSYEYNIINAKIVLEWSELLEKILAQINYSSNGNIERTLLYSLFFSFIYYFFFGKKSEAQIVLIKMNKLFYHQEYKLSLNYLIVINLFKAMLYNSNTDLIKNEENFSKCLILILLLYGEPRGRFNDSHGIMLYPLWEICYRMIKYENIIINENFREMFHALDFFEWNKSLFKLNNDNNNNINSNNINYENNVNKNMEEILLINNINKEEYKKNEINNKKLSSIIFDTKILKIKTIKHFNFPKLTENIDKIENYFKSKEFIIFLIKQIQSLFIGNKIIFDQNYINSIISPDIFNPEKYINFLKNRNNINTFMNVINLNTNQEKYLNNNTQRNNSAINSNNRIHNNNNYVYNDYSYKNNNINNINTIKLSNNKYNFFDNVNINTINQRPLSRKKDYLNNNNNNTNTNKFSHYLYKELLNKLSYAKNIPSGVVFSFGNNRHAETSHDNLIKITIPRIIFKLKNEYVEKIYSGWEHNIILTKQGEIFSFGNNKNYQCGLPNISPKEKIIKNPINISKYNNNIKAISASCGNDHTLILKNDNTVFAFGNNEEGELGLKDKNLETYKLTKINFGSYTNKIIQISAGTVHNLALTFDGKIFSWGSSQGGQLGLSEEYLLRLPGFKESYNIYEPIQVPCFNEAIVGISCGEAHSIAVDKNGSVYSWGYGSSGQLGLGFCEDDFEPGISQHKTRIFTPQKIKKLEKENIREVHCGKTFSMFLNDKREIFVCGVNDLNQLGIEEKNINNKKICSDIVIPIKLEYLYRQKVIKLSCGEGHCLAIVSGQENSKVIWSWGNNKFGQLGHGEGNDIGKRLPKPINYLLSFYQENKEKENQIQFDDISCGGFHSLCLTKYKNDIDWIEKDADIIVNTIKNNCDCDIKEINTYYTLVNESDTKSDFIGHLDINKV